MRFLIFCCVLLILGPLDTSQSLVNEIQQETEIIEKHSLLTRLNELKCQDQNNGGSGKELRDVPFSGIGDYFLPDLARSTCGAWDSCVLRCGDTIKPPYLCSCDHNCQEYGDCCVDQYYYCGTNNPSNQKLEESIPDDYIQSKASDNTEGEQCHAWFGNKFYGILYGSLKTPKLSRRCILDVPPWCHPNTSLALQWDFPQSLSILLNFGPDGWNNDLLFSSDFYDPNRCPNIWEIWDPFTQLCRPIECIDDYVLEDGRCIWDGESGKPPSNELVGYTIKKANITFHGNILMKDTVAKFGLLSIKKDMISTLSSKIRIDPTRFLNMKIEESSSSVKNPWLKPTTPKPPGENRNKLNDTSEKYKDFHDWILTEEGFPVTVNFELNQKEKNSSYDLSIEQILSILHEAVAIRAVLQTKYLVPMKINAVERSVEKEEVKFFEKWCRGGDLQSYWNEEFQVVFILKDKPEEGPGPKLTMAVKVQDTNVTYDEGTYIANLLYQSIDMNADASNVSGVVIVCENRPRIEDPSCVRLVLNETEYKIESDGTLVFEHEIRGVSSVYNRSEYEFKPNGDAVVCINYLEAKSGSLLAREVTLLEKVASILSMVLLVLSLLGLLLTIVTYGLFEELRTLPGWCLIHLCLAEFSFFLMFTVGAHQAAAQHQVLCTSISIFVHLSGLLFFAWSSVISFDLFCTFTKFQPVTRSKEKYLWRYSSFAYGVPILIVLTSVIIEFHTDIEINYGKNVCWIGDSMAALYVFAVPIATSIICNIVFFTLTVIGIKKVSNMATRSNLGQKDRARFTLYLRMSSVQCFAWIFGFLAVFTHFNEILSRTFEMLFIILSSLQGMYIFAAFVANKRVKQLYADKFFSKNPKTRDFGFSVRSTILRPTPSVGSESSNVKRIVTNDVKPKIEGSESTISGDKIPTRNNAQIAGRTVSNETCVSYLED